MNPRVRLFWIVFAAGVVLVGAVAGFTYLLSLQDGEQTTLRQFDVARRTVGRLLADQAARLDAIAEVFTSEALGDAFGDALSPVGLTSLRKIVVRDLEGMKVPPDFVSVRGPADEPWLRRFPGHVCGSNCDHPVERWVTETPNTFVVVDGEPFAISAVNFGDARIYFGMHLRESLKRVEAEIGGPLMLRTGGTVIHSGISVAPEDVVDKARLAIDGMDYQVRAEPLPKWSAELCLLQPVAPTGDAARIAAITAGGGVVLSLLVALLISTTAPVRADAPVTAKEPGPAKPKPPAAPRPAAPRPAGPEPADRREVTMLFVEVRDFPAADEGGDPARVIEALNAVLERAAGAIAHHGGTVAAQQSGELMAMFGAPRPLQDHARSGLQAAVEILARVGRWKESHAGSRGLPGGLGISVHTGIVVGGTVGAPGRAGYTLVGGEVRVARHLCAQAAAGQILASRRTADAAGDAVRTREAEIPDAPPGGVVEVLC